MTPFKLIFEKGSEGRKGSTVPGSDIPDTSEPGIPKKHLRSEPPLPELSEIEVVRHYVRLSQRNFAVDTGFYPLGSCTMKYNPKVNEEVSSLPGFARVHPYQSESTVQGCLELMYNLSQDLCEITGMDAFSLQPAAGAHGEYTCLLIARAYFTDRGEKRDKVIIPDSAHGTNPASATTSGFTPLEVKSDQRGGVDLEALRQMVGEDTAVIMLTNPNTLGLFDENIVEVLKTVHEAGGLAYCDGANMNAILGKSRPRDMGFDMMHLNLHKTFSTPHGGGGPGSGPIGVVESLEPYLPKPTVERAGDRYHLNHDRPESIGRVRSFYGNFGVMVKAYAYIKSNGPDGLKEVAENAVLSANYVMKKLEGVYELPYKRKCMHEFVLSAKSQKEKGVSAMDISKRLIDYGFHPPTMYFPLIVKEALMIEPTETESKETLDAFAETMLKIAKEVDENPDIVRTAPHTTPVKRLDGVLAARTPDVVWQG